MTRILFLFVTLFSFSTLTAQVFESLTDGMLPTNWTATSVSFATSSGGYAKFSSQANSQLITPPMTLSVGATIQFDVAKFGSGGDGPITVDVSNDGGATWTAQTFNSPTPTSGTYVTSGPTSISVTGPNIKFRFTRINSSSQKRLRNITITNALPIELVSFELVKAEKSVKLFWSTATEKNNKKFEIERASSLDGFSKIATIEGAGNVETMQHYSFIDNAPESGINYYRLRQVDFDGTTTYSKIKSVKIEKELGISIYPNPASEYIFIAREVEQTDDAIYQLFDITGRIVQTIILQEGEENKRIDLTDIPASMYYIKRSAVENGKVFIKK